MFRKLQFVVFTLFVAGTFCSTASAVPTTYTTQAAFDIAKGAVTLVTEDFSSATPALLPKNVANTFGGFTATYVDGSGSNMAFYISPVGYSSAGQTAFINSQHLGWREDASSSAFNFNGSGTNAPTVTIQFATPQTAVAFDFLDTDGSDEYNLLVDGAVINTFPSRTSFNGSFFLGLVDTTPFSTLVFDGFSPGGFVSAFGIDNVQYSSTDIPEPASLVLLASALGLPLVRRRRRA